MAICGLRDFRVGARGGDGVVLKFCTWTELGKKRKMKRLITILGLILAAISANGDPLQSFMLVERTLVPNDNADHYFYYQNHATPIYLTAIQTGVFPETEGYATISIKYGSGWNAQTHIWVDFGYNPRGLYHDFGGNTFLILPGQIVSVDIVNNFGTSQEVPAMVKEEVIGYYKLVP